MYGVRNVNVKKLEEKEKPAALHGLNQFTGGSNYNLRPSDAERLGFLVEACFPEAHPGAFSIALKQGIVSFAAEEREVNK